MTDRDSKPGKTTLDPELKVLIVDDLAETSNSLGALLREMGFANVQTRADSTEALEMVEQGEVELLITDWSIGGSTGLELLEQIRKNPTAKTLPVVMTATEEDSENLLSAICAGVSSLLVLEQDLEAIKEALRLRIETVFGVDPYEERVKNRRY